MKQANLFWSYSPTVSPHDLPDALVIEQALKYGDETDLQMLFRCYSRQEIEVIWKTNLIPDKRFRKLNTYLARVVFDTDTSILNEPGGGRFEKLRLIASRDTSGT